ncbi:hypothetical protein QYE76_022330 [Lolium multiflorum]|uniref:Transposase (putative) gypsy type domain-containing protein n=1 Tax=Lolium multiflorum TaxID=4521 RepID=A0AAD8RCJ4_LOLMU|nr:hypothetical protein QYE76_022330 [Lolium multiflorum]
MPPCARLSKHTATGTTAAMEDAQIHGWERSKLTNQDKKGLKKLGLVQKASLIFPGDESIPKSPMGYRVTFIDHLIRGLSVPIHEFLRGLLFVYGIQLHQLSPNSILHISIFVTLCECFLGSHPHWGLWKRIFYLRRNNSRSVVYNVGGVCIFVRSDVDYFDVKFPDSVQGWHKKWLYIQDKTIGGQEYGIAPFDSAAEILRHKSWDAEATAEENAAIDALMKRIHQLQNTHGEELSGVQITSHFLRIRVQPLQDRKKPLWAYTGEEDVDRLSEDLSTKDLEKLIRRFSSLSKKDEVPTSCRVEPHSGSHALPEGDLARTNLDESRAAFTRLFLHFFPKETQPEMFSALVKRFLPQEDLALAYQRENLKIGVEGTIALVANSGQKVDWTKVGDSLKVGKDKWKALVKDAKAHSKKIIDFFNPKHAGSTSTSKTELVFDNYTAAPGSSDALPATSCSKKTSVDDFTEDSSNTDLSQELNDLRQQLQSMKKQVVIIMDQSRKSSEREKIALRQAQEALTLKETTVAEAAQAVSREDYMLDLMSDASLDMAGSFLDAVAEDHRVDVRFAMIMLQICYPKLEMTSVVETCHAKLRKRKKNVDKINDKVTPVAEEMIDDLIQMDADFFMEGHYADFMGASAEDERINIDDILGME